MRATRVTHSGHVSTRFWRTSVGVKSGTSECDSCNVSEGVYEMMKSSNFPEENNFYKLMKWPRDSGKKKWEKLESMRM